MCAVARCSRPNFPLNTAMIIYIGTLFVFILSVYLLIQFFVVLIKIWVHYMYSIGLGSGLFSAVMNISLMVNIGAPRQCILETPFQSFKDHKISQVDKRMRVKWNTGVLILTLLLLNAIKNRKPLFCLKYIKFKYYLTVFRHKTVHNILEVALFQHIHYWHWI